MPQHEYIPRSYALDHSLTQSSSSIFLQCNEPGHPAVKLSFEALRPGLFRTTFTTDSHPLPPHPSVQRPPDAVTNGWHESESMPDKRKVIHNGDVTATVDFSGVPNISLAFDGQDPIHTDLEHRSYVLDGPGIAHYSRYNRNTLHVGLGEKAAPMNLANRSFRIDATDSFGYDAHHTDPLYKHIPLLINATPNGCVATFSSSHSRGSYSIGAEMDGLWGHFKVYRQDYGGLEEYLIMGKTLKETVRIYADLAGMPLLVPRWTFGYIAGGMKYSMLDEPRASDALMEFGDKLIKHDIPCSGFQMSSGYTIAQKAPHTRNVFTWNYHRFPDPKGFVEAFDARGIKLMMNIKPYLMATHPEYARLVKAGALFTDPATNLTAVARLWSAGGGESAEGGHLDLTSAAGFDFWFQGVKALRELGVACMWNDNNEFVIASDSWQCALSEETTKRDVTSSSSNLGNDIGLWGRALQTELMGKASHDAMLEVAPEERPFVLTRSASVGTLRYCASSWSGDNVTSWDGMRGANAISLTAGMCLLQCYGHDIGGFEGPQPSPELLVRWIQLGIYSSRFAINCFKTSPENNNVGDVIEPWMYPEIIPLVRKTIKRRYELIPYIYSLALESHLTASPPQRWTGWGYEADLEVWTNKLLLDGETQYWLGDSLLIGGCYQPGEKSAMMYLPKQNDDDLGFLNLNAPYQYFEAGQWVEIESTWDTSIPVLAKVGTAVPTGRDVQTVAPGDRRNPAKLPSDDVRILEIFPPKGDSGGRVFNFEWLEDDGISAKPEISVFSLAYSSSTSEIRVSLQHKSGRFKPVWQRVGISLPVGDSRTVVTMDGAAASIEPKTVVGARAIFRIEFSQRP